MALKFSEEIKQKIARSIMEETGALSFVLIMNEQTMPCPDEMAGEECQGHDAKMLVGGIQPDYLIPMFEQSIERLENK